jgi:hypothetical protein
VKSNPGQTNAKVLLFGESGAVGPKCPSLKEAPQPPKNGSPGITWAFFIGWFERGGKKTELLE